MQATLKSSSAEYEHQKLFTLWISYFLLTILFFILVELKSIDGASKIVQQVKVLAAKLDDLRLISGTHATERWSNSCKLASDLQTLCNGKRAHTHPQKHKHTR